MSHRYDPRIICRNVRVEGVTKAEVSKRVERMVLDEGGWEILHPMKSYMNSFENVVYFITLKRKEEIH